MDLRSASLAAAISGHVSRYPLRSTALSLVSRHARTRYLFSGAPWLKSQRLQRPPADNGPLSRLQIPSLAPIIN
ncbi:hypothetical protein L249_5817 [Ophiocordyceps polyrhachis-furcata BCC 54312]|uniref:Uncharacterized protein n=1 Tax=Ophiocordyceps polyrhachis-furcata BCC 54312 TaxID=1330021 RepID=A0A367L0B7_9HYPO|nr:hypothetical protein L249_5817 [Ophiocordyceps polyrhachis-furcata BCC 54312]